MKKKKDLKYHHVQVRVRESTSMVNCSVDKEWPIGRNHPFPHLIIEVFEVSDGVTADDEPVVVVDYWDFWPGSVINNWRASMENYISARWRSEDAPETTPLVQIHIP